MADKPSLFQQAQKEIKRIERAAKRAEKRGYSYDLPFRKTKSGKEKTRYTKKELEELKKTNLKDLRQYRKKKSSLASISGTIIDNAMERSKWRWNDKYYEKFLSVVNKARDINEAQTAQAFQDMINDGVLIGIQKDYKPEDFYVDFSTFTDYLDDIVPEELEEPEDDEIEEEIDEETDDYGFGSMSAEEQEEYLRLFGNR